MKFSKSIVLRALKKYIKKWRNVRFHNAPDCGALDCDLCDLFYYDECKGCPIAKKTGVSKCCNTPYGSWNRHQEEYHNNPFIGPLFVRNDCPTCKKLATQFLNFIENIKEDY